jgi:hypothetical protein
VPFVSRIGYPIDDPAAAIQAFGPASTGAAGILRIEPDQVDDAINVFQGALDKLDERVAWAKEEIRANPMAADQVSQPAAAAFNRASFDEPGAAIEVWTKAVEELESIIQQLEAQKRAILQAEDAVSQSFSSAAGAMG